MARPRSTSAFASGPTPWCSISSCPGSTASRSRAACAATTARRTSPILAVAAVSAERLEAMAKAAGCDAFLAKPVLGAALVGEIVRLPGRDALRRRPRTVARPSLRPEPVRSGPGHRWPARSRRRFPESGWMTWPSPRRHARAMSSGARRCRTRRSLYARSGGHELVAARHGRRSTGEIGHDAPVRERPRAASDEQEPAARLDAGGRERVQGLEQATYDALERSACDEPRPTCPSGARRAYPSRRAGSASARRPGTARARRPRARRRREGRGLERLASERQDAGEHVGHLRRVESAHEGKVAARRVCEAADVARRIGHRALGHRVHRARRAERDDDLACAQPDAERGRHVVACPRRDERAREPRRELAGGVGRDLGRRRRAARAPRATPIASRGRRRPAPGGPRGSGPPRGTTSRSRRRRRGR